MLQEEQPKIIVQLKGMKDAVWRYKQLEHGI